MLNDYLKKILNAPVYDVAIRSPLDHAPQLSARLNRKVWLKREDLQPISSFKLRGAYNKIHGLDAKTRRSGVITASVGNHAQGVAFAARKLETPAVVVMMAITPEAKIKAVQSHGAEVILHGDTIGEAYNYAQQVARKRKLTFVHPFDDPDVIAGQGTIGMEILQQHSDPIEAIFVPIGGGGLLAGIAAYVKFTRPEIKVIGVEPYDADSMYQALKAGHPVSPKYIDTFADGVAVRQAGNETFRVVRQYADEIIRVTNDEICAAIKDIFEDARCIAEPAGACGLAGLKKYLNKSANKHGTGDLITLVSGANIGFNRLRYIAERATVGEKREMLLSVTLPEKPGSLLKFCSILGKHSITEFNYRYYSSDKAHIFIGIQVSNYEAESKALFKKLQNHGFSIDDLTENELAKEHVRYMVGGLPSRLNDELLYRFEFPERPGALLKFLKTMSPKWNISLFHYRNHGAAYGHVLIGLQVPKSDRKKFEKFLREIKFEAFDETNNPAYRTFLKNT